jgi:hypothetical protein
MPRAHRNRTVVRARVGLHRPVHVRPRGVRLPRRVRDRRRRREHGARVRRARRLARRARAGPLARAQPRQGHRSAERAPRARRERRASSDRARAGPKGPAPRARALRRQPQLGKHPARRVPRAHARLDPLLVHARIRPRRKRDVLDEPARRPLAARRRDPLRDAAQDQGDGRAEGQARRVAHRGALDPGALGRDLGRRAAVRDRREVSRAPRAARGCGLRGGRRDHRVHRDDRRERGQRRRGGPRRAPRARRLQRRESLRDPRAAGDRAALRGDRVRAYRVVAELPRARAAGDRQRHVRRAAADRHARRSVRERPRALIQRCWRSPPSRRR